MITAYLTFAGITLTVVLSAFFKDGEANKTSIGAWMFIALTASLWPLTLPSIVRSKLRNQAKRQAKTRKRGDLNQQVVNLNQSYRL